MTKGTDTDITHDWANVIDSWQNIIAVILLL